MLYNNPHHLTLKIIITFFINSIHRFNPKILNTFTAKDKQRGEFPSKFPPFQFTFN